MIFMYAKYFCAPQDLLRAFKFQPQRKKQLNCKDDSELCL